MATIPHYLKAIKLELTARPGTTPSAAMHTAKI
jgi:hypothetical protein